MAATDVIRLVSGDERPVIILTLTDDTTGSPIDLSAVSTEVRVRFRKAGTTDTPSDIGCTKVSSGSTGKVQFDFSSGVLTDLAPGMYEGEVQINFNGQIQTVFETLRFTVRANF
jgi:hypothetical protein